MLPRNSCDLRMAGLAARRAGAFSVRGPCAPIIGASPKPSHALWFSSFTTPSLNRSKRAFE